MSTLLQRMRKINAMLQEGHSANVDFSSMASRLSLVMDATVFILSRKGKVLGFETKNGYLNERMTKMVEERQLVKEYIDGVMGIYSTQANLPFEDELSIFPKESKEMFQNSFTTILPVRGSGQRLGTLVLGKNESEFTEDDLVLAEYAATVVGIEILHEKQEEAEAIARDKAIINMAINSLSFSEKEAIEHIFQELDGQEGLLVASKVADRAGITRSVIVNALRKLESAGVIDSRSLGMKGTYIKILKPNFLHILEHKGI